MRSRTRKLDSLSPREAIALQRTRAGVKPVYVSIGHRVSLATALRYVMACTTRYRIPEPLRRAHRFAGGQGRCL
jgi:deoxyribonuclease V